MTPFMTPSSRRPAALADTASVDTVGPRRTADKPADRSRVRAVPPFTAASAPTLGSVTKPASAGFVALLSYATCVPVFMTTERIAVPVGSAACACFRHTWLKRLSPRRLWPLSSSFPECISALSGSATVIDVAFLPVSTPRESHTGYGATAAAEDAAKANSNCIKQVSCTFRNACLVGLARTSGPQNARIVTPIMRPAILLNRQGFPALQPFLERRSRQRLHLGCAAFSCISCTRIRRVLHQVL